MWFKGRAQAVRVEALCSAHEKIRSFPGMFQNFCRLMSDSWKNLAAYPDKVLVLRLLVCHLLGQLTFQIKS